MTITNDRSASLVSGASERTDNLPGKVYFIRHGESTSNERNIFAGILDVGLTAFGKLQARRAGMDIKKKGMKFDAVYTVKSFPLNKVESSKKVNLRKF